MVGMMGSGKTAVGKFLATLIDVPFVDSDDEIVAAANMSIAEIFERDGEAFFRSRETEVIERLLAAQPCIISAGGGLFLSERNRDLIKGQGVSLWLKADLNLLWSRVRHKNTRPLLRTPNPRATLKELLSNRTPFYEMADICVETKPAFSIEATAKMAQKALIERQDIVEVAQ
ncbi:MAG: shikimate kinase [Pseudomonadota bacterium]